MNAFNVLLNAISCVDLEPNKAVALLERIIEYRDVVQAELDHYRFENSILQDHNYELNSENTALCKKVAELEAQAKSLSPAKPAIKVHLSDILDKSEELQEQFIPFVKWVRTSGVDMGDGSMVGLYEAKFIADYVFAYFDYKTLTSGPTRGEQWESITLDSNREDLEQNIVWLLNFNYKRSVEFVY